MAQLTTSGPQQGVSMPAVDLRQYVGGLVAAEGLRTIADLQVAQRAAGANMSVDVSAGTALFQDDHATGGGFYGYTLATTTNFAVTSAHASLPRIDRVVVKLLDQFLGDASNAISVTVIAGTPTAGATLSNLTGAAAVPSSSLLLANILVPAASSSVTTANIANVSPVLKTVSGATVYHSASAQTVSSSTSLTSVLSQSIPAGVIGANGMVRVTIPADIAVAAAETFLIKISLGGTTLFQSTSGSITTTGNYNGTIGFTIANIGSQAVNYLQGEFPSFGSAMGAVTVGRTTGSAHLLAGDSGGTTTVDTSAAVTLDVSIQHSVSNAGNTYNRRAWAIEIF